MRITKDNYELVMFDLLEGNLSEQQAIHVMGQIEEDEFLFKEWKLFKSTILIADKSVTYGNKSALLKAAPTVVPLWRTKWAAAAAVVLILTVAVLLFPRNNPDEIATNPIIDEVESIDESPVEEAVVETIIEPENDDSLSQTVEVSYKPNYRKQSLVNDDLLDILPQLFPKEDVVENNQEETVAVESPVNNVETKNVPLNDVEIPTEVVVNNPMKKELEDVEIPTPEVVVSDEFRPSFVTLMNDIVTSEPKDRIRDKVAGFFSLISNPKIRFKPNMDGSPSLDIELETEGYEAIASLQPFNRNK